MKKRNVIPFNHYPTRLPLFESLVTYMALDIYNAPGWLWGAVCVVWALFVIACIAELFTEVHKPLPGYGKDTY